VDWDFFVAGLGAPQITWGTRSVLLSFVRNHIQFRADSGDQVREAHSYDEIILSRSLPDLRKIINWELLFPIGESQVS
jgi:hypothetical protein